MQLRTVLLASIIAMAAAAPASGNEAPAPDVSKILQQQAAIRADVMARSGRYKDLPEDKRNTLLNHQQVVTSRLGGVQTTAQLNEHDRIAVFNALEAIEAIVNKAEDDRMICKRHKPVGSNRPQTVCRTVAQLRAEEDNNEQRRNQVCVDAWNSGACKN